MKSFLLASASFLLISTISCNSKTETKTEPQPQAPTAAAPAQEPRAETHAQEQPLFIVDTAQVLAAFNRAQETDKFTKELGLEGSEEAPAGSVYYEERPLLIGDLNGDALTDALMPFTIEGRGGGNNWDAHYAVFLNTGKSLDYQFPFSRGGDFAERITHFTSIKNGKLLGWEVTRCQSRRSL